MGAAELAVVVEGESEFRGVENEVVMFVGLVVGGMNAEATGHAEVDFEGELLGVFGEGKEEAFSVGAGVGEGGVGEGGFDFCSWGVAVDAGAGVGFDGDDFFFEGGEPGAAGEFDFGEFGHEVGN